MIYKVRRTIIRKTIPKSDPKTIIIHTNYKLFNKSKFNEELKSKMQNMKNNKF